MNSVKILRQRYNCLYYEKHEENEYDNTVFPFYLKVPSCFNKLIEVNWQRFLHAYTKMQRCLEDHTHISSLDSYKK